MDPITGRVREEMSIDGNPIPASFDYTRQNLAWQARTSRIQLFRGSQRDGGLSDPDPRSYQGRHRACSDLRGPVVIQSSRDIEVFKQWYFDVRKNSSNQDSTTAGYNLGTGWYADALVPVSAGGGVGQPFRIPATRCSPELSTSALLTTRSGPTPDSARSSGAALQVRSLLRLLLAYPSRSHIL